MMTVNTLTEQRLANQRLIDNKFNHHAQAVKWLGAFLGMPVVMTDKI